MSILVSFRFDDPSLSSDHRLEKKIFSVFERHNMQLCVGVVPYLESDGTITALEAEQALHLLEAKHKGVIEIALHGHSHTRKGWTSDGAPSEFVNLPEQQQLRLIQDGKRQLEKVFGKVDGFIPPWNTYDSITEKVLKEQGFTFVSASWHSPRPSPNLLPNIYRTVHAHHAWEALQQAYSFKELRPIVNILFHHFDFEEYEKNEHAVFNLDRLDHLLGWIKTQADLKTVPLSTAAQQLTKYSPRKNLNYHEFTEWLPQRIRWRLPSNHIFLASNWKIISKVLAINFKQRFGSQQLK